MSLTIKYLGLSEKDIQTLKRELGKYETYFVQTADTTIIMVNGSISEMLMILNITSKYRHSDLLLKK